MNRKIKFFAIFFNCFLVLSIVGTIICVEIVNNSASGSLQINNSQTNSDKKNITSVEARSIAEEELKSDIRSTVYTKRYSTQHSYYKIATTNIDTEYGRWVIEFKGQIYFYDDYGSLKDIDTFSHKYTVSPSGYASKKY